MLYDFGKVTSPDSILNKPGPLDDQETSIMRLHAQDGERTCMPLRSVGHFPPIIRHHHERVDGAGYPDHLSGSLIPLVARIAAIGDTRQRAHPRSNGHRS